MTEVLIVGASFAGLTAARELRGRDVLLVDRSPIGAHQTSACALPVALAEWLGIGEAILHADSLMRISVGRERWDVRLPEAFAVIDYERACLLLAAQSDARFEQVRVTGRDGDAVLGADGERLTADWLIDGSGWRRVLDPAGATEGRDPQLVIGTEDHVPTALAPRADGFGFYLERSLLRSGYGWSFPAGDHVRAGVGSFIKEPLRPAMDRLRERDDLGPGREHHGGAIACVPRAPVADRVLFAGDAAGHALPVTLEGIRPAAYFGACAGRLVNAALAGDLTAAEARDRYRALHARHLGGYARLNRIQRLYRYLPEPVLRRLVTRGVGAPARRDGEVAFRSLRYLDVLRPERLPALP
ncbi:MAG: NAD(P)/FAD-dependent oxidoreductase [Actinomycetota bacterium]